MGPRIWDCRMRDHLYWEEKPPRPREAGPGRILVEAAALAEHLKTVGAKELDQSRWEVTDAIHETDIGRLSRLANSPGKG